MSRFADGKWVTNRSLCRPGTEFISLRAVTGLIQPGASVLAVVDGQSSIAVIYDFWAVESRLSGIGRIHPKDLGVHLNDRKSR